MSHGEREADGTGREVLPNDLKVFLVEDEAIISFLVEDMLTELGCALVGTASSVGEALGRLETTRPDLAIIDLNLGGEPSLPVASALAAAGVPFLFATGYGSGGLPPEWANRPVAQKPFQIESLQAAMIAALRR